MAHASPSQHLDQLVKGAPAPSQFPNPPPYTAHPSYAAPPHLKPPRPPFPPSDPTALLPSSPPQIYLNLLILEASLRSQYLTLRARRRQNTFVLTLLSIWIAFFFYLLWLRPREDGKGIGGSRYWLVDMFQKMCFITGLVTALLFWATGQWERGVRWPRRWVGVANRGLRGMNAKIVVMRGSWGYEIRGWLGFVLPFSGGLWGGETGGSSYHFVNLSQEKEKREGGGSEGVSRVRIVEDGKEYAEEDIAPGGDLVKLILLPKPFSPDFREGWEIFRAEYWGRENERRGELRRRIRARQREVARAEGGVFWWTGWRGWKRSSRHHHVAGRASEVDRSGHHGHAHGHAHHLSASFSSRDRKRRPSSLRGRDASLNSRSSSRSTTPTPDLDDTRPSSHDRERRWSTSTAGSTASSLSYPHPTRPVRGPSLSGPAPASLARQASSRLSSSSSAGRPTTPNRGSSGLSVVDSVGGEYEADASGLEEGVVGSGGGGVGATRPPGVKRRGSAERERESGRGRGRGVSARAPSA